MAPAALKDARDGAGATKRKWAEVDWEVALEAQSFVAVFADPVQGDVDEDENDDDEDGRASAQKTKAKVPAKRGRKSKKASQVDAPAPAKKTRSKAAAAPPASTRATRSRAKSADANDSASKDSSDSSSELKDKAASAAAASAAPADEFWIAQLLDDVTEDMFEDEDASVRVTWLNRVADASGAKAPKYRYEYAFDDTVTVQSILCHVFLIELSATTLEITPKSLKRIQRSIARTKTGDDAADGDDDDLNERPPSSRMTERAIAASSKTRGGGGSTGGGGGRSAKASSGSGGAKKLSKRDEALLVPPLYTTVDLDKYATDELLETHGYRDLAKDTFAMNREVFRAVLTKNHKLLKKLTTDKSVYRSISSFTTARSADIALTPLQYAIIHDDVTAASLLLKARELENDVLAKRPSVSLPSHSTGKHTSAYSDYNRRTINASRGGKEGNKALVEDTAQAPISADAEVSRLWDNTTTSSKMLTLVYPTGDWSMKYNVPYTLAHAARKGNYRFVAKVVETLAKNGGWGFNNLHVKVLSDTDDDLPLFRAVSAMKMASQTRIRPLHLAAINPNVKYLEAMYESTPSEWSAAKDANGYEPIHYAAVCEGTGPLAFLLERKVRLFTRTKSRETPMVRALLACREDNAILMLEHAADDDDEVLKQLVAERGTLSRQPIHYAAEQGCARVLAKLLELGADINCPAADKMTPLCYAAQMGHVECVEALLRNGAKVDGSDKLKKTPLIYAVKNGHTHIAALLINHGANVNAYDTSENSVVHYAASYGWLACLRLLADTGADFWVRNSWGFVPLICALLQRRLSASEFILEHDESQRFLDFRDRQGCTMLFLQCKHSSDVAQIQYLLEKGLSPDICDSEQQYPLQALIARAARAHESGTYLASSSDGDETTSFFDESVRLLLKHGAKSHYTITRPKSADTDDSNAEVLWQPLQLAMQGSLERIFDLLLLEFGADPSATASDGSDAWMTAASLGRRGNRYVEAMLKHHAKTHKGTKLAFSARAGEKDKDNFFHIVARNSVKDSLSPALVRQCIAQCAHPSTLMHEKDSAGYSPLLALLQQERKVRSLPSSDAERSDRLDEDQKSDAAYSELVALFAEATTSVEALTRFVPKSVAKQELAGAAQDAIDASDAQSSSGNNANSDGSDNDDDDASEGSASGSGSDEENDGSDDDDDDDDGSGSDSSAGARKRKARKDAAKEATSGDSDSTDDKHALLQFEAALHLAANRKLTCGAADVTRVWHGENLVAALFAKCRKQLKDAALVNFPDYTNHKTALQYAVEASDLESVRALVTHDADPNHSPFRCDVCQSALLPSASATETSEPCVSSCGTALVDTALYAAVQRGHVAITKLLLAHNADVACFQSKTLNTPLHAALGANNAEITRELLGHGADLSKRNASGQAPLHFAVHAKHSIPETEPHQDEVTYTDLSKASASSKTSSQSSAKTAATAAKLSAIQVALRDKKAAHAVVLKDSTSLTPIHLAAANRDLALLRDLVKACNDKAAAMNTRDAFGRTPLHYAVNKATMSPDASFEVERFLLTSGADANLVDAFGFSALHFALLKVDFAWHEKYDDEQTSKHAEQAQLDRESGEYDAKKERAFHKAIATIPDNETDPVETVSNLAAVRGINVAAQDVLGRSPLHLAAATGAFVCVSMLLSVCATESERVKLLALEDKESFTALGQGVLHLRQTTIMTLLQNKADVRGQICIKTEHASPSRSGATTAGNETPTVVKTRHFSYFYHAVKHSLSGICHMLLTAKFCLRQAIEDAVRCGQFQLAYNLMIGTEVSNDATLLTRLNDRQESLLHALAKVGKPFNKLARTIAWTLVDAGVSVHARNAKGNTALHYAAKNGSIHLMDFLLHNASDVNRVNSAGETPLLYAMKHTKVLDHPKLVQVLKYVLAKPGVDLHVKDASGMNILTALLDRFADTQADSAHFAWIESLLKKGVDPNGLFTSLATRDLFANAALAASSVSTKMPALIRMIYAAPPVGRYHSIALLLRYGAKVTVADARGNSVLMHLVAKNLVREVKLVLGLTKRVLDPTAAADKRVLKPLHIAPSDVKAALAQTNRSKQTALHFAVKPFAFESYENSTLVQLLIDAGASVHAKDAAGRSVLDYTRSQASRFLFRFLKTQYPSLVSATESAFFHDPAAEDEPMFESAPDYAADAQAYLSECERSGKIVRKLVEPEVNANCDVGKVSHVHAPVDATGASVKTEAYSALLTKVDVRNGRFGLNVFYRLQVVHDELQGLFIVFTNWGRIGETGKFQNTPFHGADDAIAEFKKIFRSKTGNHWDERRTFVKQSKKYNLVQRVNTHTTVDKAVTVSFTEVEKDMAFPSFTDAASFPPSVVTLLSAITDIRNLELAATEGCNFRDSLPLAKKDELEAALAKLLEIRTVIEERDVVNTGITEAGGDLTDDGAAKLTELSDKYTELTETISEMSSRYYEVMPCNEDAFGASIKAFDSVTSVNTEVTRLRLLVDIMDAYQMLLGAKRLQHAIHPLEYCYNAMQVQLTPMHQDVDETKLLTKYFYNGLRPHQHAQYRVANVFQVNRQGEKTRLEAFHGAHASFKTKHSQLLWHGTRRTNLMGILSQGLRIAPPEAPHHGYMYGKGLYFADVTAKSVDYCGSPYRLKTTSVNADGKSVERERTVFYMLLCEVAAGNATELDAPTFAETIPDDIESVKALSKFVPDPAGSVVSPESGAKLHLGRIGEVGSTVPIDTIWAKTDYSPQPTSWYERQVVFTNDTRRVLSAAIDKLSVGESLTVETADRPYFSHYNTYSDKKYTIELVSKVNSGSSSRGAEDDGSGEDVGAYCDATVKVIFSDEMSSYSYSVKRYRNFHYGVPMEKGFALVPLNLADYSEYIVYNESQARIRYLLEVEQVERSRS